MARLSKEASRRHSQAQQLVALHRDLDEEERGFVLANYQESANPVHGLDDAYFTPRELALDFCVEVVGDRLIDLCAGIGHLAYHAADPTAPHRARRAPSEIVRIERNPEYVQVGRKVVPQARWIEADVLDLPATLGTFNCAFGNPPFGTVPRSGNPTAYTGSRFEYHAIAVAERLADFGVFSIPQSLARLRHSGLSHPVWPRDAEYQRFTGQTGLELTSGCIATSGYARQWRGVAPAVEVVVCDFESARVGPLAAHRCQEPGPTSASLVAPSSPSPGAGVLWR